LGLVSSSAPAALEPVRMARILRTWWPLAASWMLMAIELPLASAVMARLPSPDISLAAYGGVVFPLSMLVEAPIIMLLSASTALSTDRVSYAFLHRFMMASGAVLTVLHAAIAFTPLYDVIVGGIMGPPEEVLGPARYGLMIMTPWTWAIAYRRFQQGVMIRFGRSHHVGIGTAVRVATNAVVLGAGVLIGNVPGIIVGCMAVALGVVAEAAYAGISVRPTLRGPLREAPLSGRPLTARGFTHFYLPLALTSLLAMAGIPIISAGIGRLPLALASLAALPVVNGVTFLLRSLGFALNEVVVALVDRPGAYVRLRRFAMFLGVASSAILLLLAATPLSTFYFRHVAALSPELEELAVRGLWVVLPMPFFSALQAWFQGKILHSRRTRGITESVALYLVVSAGLMFWGTKALSWTGLYVGLSAVVAGSAVQIFWMWVRSRGLRPVAVEDDGIGLGAAECKGT